MTQIHLIITDCFGVIAVNLAIVSQKRLRNIGGLTVSVLELRLELFGFKIWSSQCVVYLAKILYSHSTSLTQEKKWVLLNCQGSLMKCWG